MSNIKTRKKPKKSTPTLDREISTKLYIVNQFVNGQTYEEIAEDTGWDVDSVRLEVRKFYISFKKIMETQSLIDDQIADGQLQVKSRGRIAAYKRQKEIDEDINEKFLSKLSDQDDNVLTQEEVMFCYMMVHEGDELAALTESGLADGLDTSGSSENQRALRLRCLMLKGKPNVIKYIHGIQMDYAKELGVNREMVQSEIVQQLRLLKAQNNPRLAPTIAKLTEQLGRTVGAFMDKIEVSEVSFDDAMDRMMETRRIKEKEAKEQGIDPKTYVYDPDKIK